jgi:toxin-antitoxin system PIN domain toxin
VSVALLDVNLLVALAWPNHIHHGRAHAWFQRKRDGGWATCPLTQSGFVRVSSNHRVIPEAKTPAETIVLLRRILDLPHHQFWHDDVSIGRSPEVGVERILDYRQVTDAHLLALAIRRGGKLATFDRGVAELVGEAHHPRDVIEILP